MRRNVRPRCSRSRSCALIRLYGVTTLDVTRASTFLSGISGAKPSETIVPVVGGHSGVTIVPILSQQTEGASILKEGGQKLADLVKRIQFGGDEVVKAKDGAGSATLSMAYAGAVFADALMRAMNGESGVVSDPLGRLSELRPR